LRRSAPLHDIGKIGVRDAVLLKPGPLTPEEKEHMRAHTTIGAELLRGSSFAIVQAAELIAATHHERWDGTGYPNRLARTAIPLFGRITAVADVFDALTNVRPYKPAWTVDRAMAHITAEGGKHFDPDVVAAFLRVVERTPVSTAGRR